MSDIRKVLQIMFACICANCGLLLSGVCCEWFSDSIENEVGKAYDCYNADFPTNYTEPTEISRTGLQAAILEEKKHFWMICKIHRGELAK